MEEKLEYQLKHDVGEDQVPEFKEPTESERKAAGKVIHKLQNKTLETKELKLIRPGYTFHNKFAQDGMADNKIK